LSDRRTHDVSRQAIKDRVDRLQLSFNSLGIDSFGVSKPHLVVGQLMLGWLYEKYFRVRAYGVEHVPDKGRAMLVGNHSGGVAIDGAMVVASMFLEKDPPRLAQGMADKFLNRFPISSTWTARTGQLTGLPEHAERLLLDDRLLMVFPEGASGTAKLYGERNSLVEFGTGFVRLAMKTRTPIVPFGFIGGGEAIPTVVNSTRLGKLLGVPYVPFTPYGLALPLPVPLAVYYGEPLVFEGDGTEEDSVIQAHVDRVKAAIAALIAQGNEGRTPFLGGGAP
jgi:1-acyl-sn-glycerol-3-phosphate acyltransferase